MVVYILVSPVTQKRQEYKFEGNWGKVRETLSLKQKSWRHGLCGRTLA
jgi:hypothetical protein